MNNQPLVYEQSSRPGCLLQLLWFVFVGWWLGLLWVTLAWLMCVSIIALPLSITMLNRVPQIIALRGRRLVQVIPGAGVRDVPQINPIIRVIYFLLIGIWLSALWMVVAYALCLTIIGLPFGFLMFDAVPVIVSLKRT